MSDPDTSASAPGADGTREEYLSAQFASLVLQSTNMAMLFLGQVPHPDSGKIVKDLEAARMFIDQLEMLEVKTKGNLEKQEESLLKQSLMNLRMAFVQAVNEGPTPPPQAKPETASAPAPGAEPAPTGAASQAEAPASEPPKSASDADDRKKFVKKY